MFIYENNKNQNQIQWLLSISSHFAILEMVNCNSIFYKKNTSA
ncbi:hypothetical protein MuYL_3787 [Mucilaginibacter xinganensis]|uniref:Uncharacterized protein n=1 Tax=Mucilaginibacter xinganensis TaxID=1234841 RepID=A0A223P0N1_9SPHI|nr:hypothetical protein MuYL_3787 [Mucilaginibacter xinganensis]